MCAMALMHARFRRVVFGATDPKTGACGSIVNLFGEPRLNHHTTVQGGLLDDECARMLRGFFAERRAAQRAGREPGHPGDAAAADADEAIPTGEVRELGELPPADGSMQRTG